MTTILMDTLKKEIAKLEKQISENQGNIAELQQVLHTLKMRVFEEDMRETDNRQLLKG